MVCVKNPMYNITESKLTYSKNPVNTIDGLLLQRTLFFTKPPTQKLSNSCLLRYTKVRKKKNETNETSFIKSFWIIVTS